MRSGRRQINPQRRRKQAGRSEETPGEGAGSRDREGSVSFVRRGQEVGDYAGPLRLAVGRSLCPLSALSQEWQLQGSGRGREDQAGGEEVKTLNAGQSSGKFGCESKEGRVAAGEDTVRRESCWSACVTWRDGTVCPLAGRSQWRGRGNTQQPASGLGAPGRKCPG